MPWYDSNVILCQWKQLKPGFKLWVKEDPRVSGEGEDFESAHEALLDAIMQAAPQLDDVIPTVPEFEPPLPAAALAERFLKPEVFRIAGDAIFECPHQSRAENEAYAATLFEGGICPVCRSGVGPRTDVPLIVGAADWHDVGFYRDRFSHSPTIVSDRFLELLTPDELKSLEFVPIEVSRARPKRKYFELRGSSSITQVHVAAFDADGVECGACGYRSFSSWEPALEDECSKFCCTEDLPEPLPSLFLISSAGRIELCATAQRRRELFGQVGTKGLFTARVGFVSRDACVERPRLRRYSREQCPTCSQWPECRRVDYKKGYYFNVDERDWSQSNFKWQEGAIADGELLISRQTCSIQELADMAWERRKPKSPEFVSFRCTDCWRLAYITLFKDELAFVGWA